MSVETPKSVAVAITGANAAVCTNNILNGIVTPPLLGVATNGVTYNAAVGTGACTAGAAISCTINGVKGGTSVSATATIICTG